MAVELHALIGSVLRPRREKQPATQAELQRSTGQVAAALRRAGLERGLLLQAVNELGSVAHLLRSLAAEHRRARGETHAVHLAEAAANEAIALQYDARPMSRYLPDQYLRTRLWSAVQSIERARIALRWEQLEGER